MKEFDVTDADGLETLLSRFVSLVEGKMEVAFSQIAEWLEEELHHEQQHLMLMQNQVDKQNKFLEKELADIRKIIGKPLMTGQVMAMDLL